MYHVRWTWLKRCCSVLWRGFGLLKTQTCSLVGCFVLKLEYIWVQAVIYGTKRCIQNVPVTWSLGELCSCCCKSSWLHNQKDTAKWNFPGRCVRRKLSHLMKNMKARLTFGRGNVDKALDFMICTDGSKLLCCCFGTYSICYCYLLCLMVFKVAHCFKICDRHN